MRKDRRFRIGNQGRVFLVAIVPAVITGLFLLVNTLIQKVPPNDEFPTIPPVQELDGNYRLLFVNSKDGNEEIYLLSANRQIRLTDNPYRDNTPYWSPDGSRIAFTSNRTGDHHIYIMNSDGTQVTPVTLDIGLPGEAFCPFWSPDGRYIVFSGNAPSGPQEIYRLDLQSMIYENISKTDGVDEWCPKYSPDGRRLVFHRNEAEGESSIMILDLVHGTLSRLTSGSSAVWSPDGARIAFQSERDGDLDIYIINQDGSSERNLTNNDRDDKWPVWSPDADAIAFSSDTGGIDNIYIIQLGIPSNIYRLTESNFPVTPQDWRK